MVVVEAGMFYVCAAFGGREKTIKSQ